MPLMCRNGDFLWAAVEDISHLITVEITVWYGIRHCACIQLFIVLSNDVIFILFQCGDTV